MQDVIMFTRMEVHLKYVRWDKPNYGEQGCDPRNVVSVRPFRVLALLMSIELFSARCTFASSEWARNAAPEDMGCDGCLGRYIW